MKFFLTMAGVFFSISCFAQQFDSVFKRIDDQLLLKNADNIYVQVDKALYQTGEKIWFAGYSLNMPAEQLHTLHVLLVNDMSQTVVNEQHFVIDKGFSNGSISLSDTLQTGEYSLIAYTNLFASQPVKNNFFRQPLEVIGKNSRFKISFVDAGKKSDDSIFLTAKINLTSVGLPHKGELQYSMYANGNQIKKETKKLNVFGETELSFPSAITTETLEMVGTISEEKEKKKDKEEEKTYFKIPLLWESKNNLIRLFPENGSLINNQASKLYFQLTSTSGKGIAANLQLLQDSIPVSTFESDVYGIGVIELVPHKGSSYTIAVKNTDAKLIQHFPEIKEEGYSVTVLNKEEINDSLSLLITSPSNEDHCIISVQNNKEVFTQLAIKLNHGKGKLSLPTADWKKGICTILVFDDKAILQARQTIMMPDTAKQIITITTDSSEYHNQSTVTVHVNIKDRNGNPLQSVFSLSTALTRTITERYTDIVRFNYFDRYMNPSYVLPSFNYLQENDHVKKELAVYNNTDVLNEYNKGIDSYVPIKFDGNITLFDKKLKKPVNLAIISSGITNFASNKDGTFTLPVEALRCKMGNRVFLDINQNQQTNYTIIIDSSEKKLNNLLASQYFCLPAVTKKDDATIQQKKDMQRLKANILPDVTVHAQQKIRILKGNRFGGVCNDWICLYGILDCRNHSIDYPGSRRLYDGEIINGMRYVCQDTKVPAFFKPLQPTYYGDDFPSVDYAKATDSIAPELLSRSTLYWAPSFLTDEKGEATLHFYANNLNGKFTCLLQGINTNGVFHAKTDFTVK